MRQWEVARQVGAEITHLLSHAAAAEHVRERVAADEQRQADIRHQRQQLVAPERGAFGARWRVAAVGQAAGIAEAHRDDGNAGFVVEGVAVHLQPGAQAVAGRVVEREAGLVHRGARRLAGNQQTCRGGDTDDRTRAKRQVLGADAAGADFGGKRGEWRGPLPPTPSRKGRGSRCCSGPPPPLAGGGWGEGAFIQ